MGYIYMILNQINNKKYVGKTERTINERWKEHIKNMYKLDLPLYRALRKYGLENFTVTQLDEGSKEELDEKEIFWIRAMNSYGEDGYNCTGGGEGGITIIKELPEMIARYKAGERIDSLCKEYHHDYYKVKESFESAGVIINTTAGPQKLSKKIYALNPKTKEVVYFYDSISQAARSICPEGRNPRAIGNHISKYKDTDTVSHGFLWRTELEK